MGEYVATRSSDWEVLPFGSLAKECRRTGYGDAELLSVYLDRGVIRYSESSGQVHKPSLDLSAYQLVKPGDLVLNNQQAWRGSVGVSSYRGIVSPAYVVCSLSNRILPGFARYLFRSPTMVDQYVLASKGVGSIQRNLVMQRLRRAPVPLPAATEQRLIARYLDATELRIAKAMQAKRLLIGQLEELAAVRRWNELTGGDPARQVVPGVEWMGPVPASFVPVRLKSIFSERTVRSVTGRQALLSLRMREGLVRSSDYTGRPEDPEKLTNYKVVEPGQLVMNRMRASIGLFGVAESPGIVSPDYAVFDIRDGFHGGFMLLLLKSPQCGSVIRANSRGMGTGSSGFLRIYTDAFGRLQVAVPPLADQVARCDKAAEAAQELEKAISALRAEVSLLSEYRVRLISDVVTGKRDVRADAERMKDVDPAELASVLAGATVTENDELGEDGDAE